MAFASDKSCGSEWWPSWNGRGWRTRDKRDDLLVCFETFLGRVWMGNSPFRSKLRGGVMRLAMSSPEVTG